MGFKVDGPDKIDAEAFAYGSSARSVLSKLEDGDTILHDEDPGWRRGQRRYRVTITIQNVEDEGDSQSLSW